MSNIVTIEKTKDEKWNEHAEINAQHRAKIFIDADKPEKVASALKELPYKKAMTFLYHLGMKYLHHHDRRAHTIAKASDLMDKKILKEKENPDHRKHIPLLKRHTVSEIFSKEI